MHDNQSIYLNPDGPLVFYMMAFFIMTYEAQFLLKKFWLVIGMVLGALFIIDGWKMWQLYLCSGLALILATVNTVKSKRPYKKLNRILTMVYLVIQPCFLIILSPIVIPQTNVAVGVVLALMVWSLVSFLSHIFYNNNKRLLCVELKLIGLVYFMATLFFHHWLWVPFGVSLGVIVIFSSIFSASSHTT